MASRETHQAKLEAYEKVLLWSQSESIAKEDIIWYLQQNIAAHGEYVRKMKAEGLEYLNPSDLKANGHAQKCMCEDCV